MVTVPREIADFVEDVSDAPRHAGGEIATGRPQDHDPAAGHVFAAVIAYRFDYRMHAAVADAEALPRHATDVGLAAGRPIQGNVTDNDILLRHKCRSRRRENDDLAAR